MTIVLNHLGCFTAEDLDAAEGDDGTESPWDGLARLARLPQVSLPLAETADGPVGLGVIAGHGNDEMLLDLAVAVAE